MKKELPHDINHYLPKLRKLGLFIQDVEQGIAYPNELWTSMGYTDKEMLNMGFMNYIHPDDIEIARSSVDDLMNHEDHMSHFLFRMKSRQGHWHWILSTSLGVEYTEDGKVSKYFGYDHDVTKEIETQKRLEKALKEAELLRTTSEIITSQLDLPHTINAILKQAELVFSFTSASVQILEGDSLEVIGSVGFKSGDCRGKIKLPLNLCIPDNAIVRRAEGFIINENLLTDYPDFQNISGSEVLSWMGAPLLYQGKVTGVITFCHTESFKFDSEDLLLAQAFANQVAVALINSRLYEDAKELAIKDVLTGCYSRRHFFDVLDKEIHIVKRYGGELSLIIFDLDDFKKINDDFGHIKGDETLRQVVKICQMHLRDSDLLCRYGGEEFSIVLPRASIDDAFATAERIRTSISSDFSVHGISRNVSVSLGCSTLKKTDDDSLKDLINRADLAMYKSKRSGKNRTSLEV